MHRDQKYLILVATSGDTGGAVLDGFTKCAGRMMRSLYILVTISDR